MPDEETEYRSSVDRLNRALDRRRDLLALGPTYGFDERNTWGQLEDRMELIRRLIEWGEHEALGQPGEFDFPPPDKELDPKLGTTIGDVDGPGGYGLEPDTSASIKEDLTRALAPGATGPGGKGPGIKLGTGDAAGKKPGDDAGKKQDNPLNKESSDWDIAYETFRNNNKAQKLDHQSELLEKYVKSIDNLAKACKRNEGLWKVIQKIFGPKTPHPDDVPDNGVSNHPLSWPAWVKRHRTPDKGPLWDPTKMEEAGSTRVLKDKGQATDPIPDDQRFTLEKKKARVYIFDGVIDPIRRLFSRILRR